MIKREVSPPILIAVAATRAMLGFGAGLLVSRRVPRSKRRKLGWTLVGVGCASTIPLAAKIFRR